MLDEALAWGLQPYFMTGDSWYSCVNNLKTVKNHRMGFVFAVESNRRKLSGRQMRHKQAFSNPALLAGLWALLAMFKVMDAYFQEELDGFRATAKQFLGEVV